MNRLQLLQDDRQPRTGQPLNWLWLPGWSFAPTVFAPLYRQLPGRHWGFHYPSEPCSLAEVVTDLQQQAPAGAIHVGWSLGGALAALAADADTPLVTLASSPCFSTTGAGDDAFGPPADVFQQFQADFETAPQRTLKRFCALCSQGANDARSLSRQLQAQQLQLLPVLQQSLNWLADYRLPTTNNQHQYKHQHWYGQQDALRAGGLTPAYTSNGGSHAFFLETAAQPQLLASLLAIAAGGVR